MTESQSSTPIDAPQITSKGKNKKVKIKNTGDKEKKKKSMKKKTVAPVEISDEDDEQPSDKHVTRVYIAIEGTAPTTRAKNRLFTMLSKARLV
jgi:hypothetical protein